MEEKQMFKEGLQQLRRRASANFNHITIAEILECFRGRDLTRDEVSMIYEYAGQEGIVIENYQPHDTRSVQVGEEKKPELTGEEKETFRMYLEDLENVIPCEDDEREMLAERLINGEDEVIGRLTEGHLSLVLDLARTMAGRGVLIGDLVQEGNMALMMALSDLAAGQESLRTDLKQYLEEKVTAGMAGLLGEWTEYRRAGDSMARETNRLLQATVELEEELGREATLEELAGRIRLPEEKVKELIQISLSAAEHSRDSEGESN